MRFIQWPLIAFLLATPLSFPAYASETGEFQQRVGEYSSGVLSPAEFLEICTLMLQDAPLKNSALESQVRRYRGAVNVQLNNYSAAVQDAEYLAKLPDSRLAGMQMLALIAQKRFNYPKAIAITDAILEELDKGDTQSGINPDRMREIRNIQEAELKTLVNVSAEDLAGEIAKNPGAATAQYAGKKLLVTGKILALPPEGKDKPELVLQATPPLFAYLGNDELHFFNGLKAGDSIRIVGPLQELKTRYVISPAYFLEDEGDTEPDD